MSRSLLAVLITTSVVLGTTDGPSTPGLRSWTLESVSSGSVGLVGPADDELEGVRQTLRMGEAGTYIAEILRARDSALARWRDRHGAPLRVWIEPHSDVEDWHGRYVNEVRNAFSAWDTLALPVRFRIVSDSANAHVHVNFINRFREPISGRTRWARDEDYWITDASITLAVHHRTGEVLEDDAMHAMALHEVGHLLGLDHTTDPSSVMAPKVRVRGLSAADRATARLLYSVPAGPVTVVAARR